MCHTVNPFTKTASPANGHCNESLLWLKASGFCYIINTGSHWDLCQISRCCPVSWRSCNFDSAGPAPSGAPAVLRWDRHWGGPTQSPKSGPGWYLSWSTCLLSCTYTYTTRKSSLALPNEGWGRLSCLWQLASDGTSSWLTASGPALPYPCHQDQVSSTALVRGGASSPKCHIWQLLIFLRTFLRALFRIQEQGFHYF